MGSIDYRPDRRKPWRARYWGPDGKLHNRHFARKTDAERWLISEEASKLRGDWTDPSRARQRFDDWANEWWAVWSSHPHRSPAALEVTENRLRRHVRPYFGRHPLRVISVQMIQSWQNQLEATLGHESVMACRSILFRILQAAEDDQIIPSNPVRRVKAPKRPVDPEVVFGRIRRRAYTCEEFGRFLAACPTFYRDHFLVQVGTGLRSGELLGLRASRVKLEQPRIEVVEVRYDAGKFGVGYKNRPKSDASIRLVPLARPVAEAVARRLVGCAPDGLVFCGPGGGNTLARGVRSKLSIDNYRRVYHRIADRAGLIGLDLHGPHDLRHTFATWLEDGGIPARVIDELMGHHTGRGREHDGSAIGARYRHMTPEMQARVLAVIEQNFASMSQACPKTDEPGQLDG
jgi:integrase